MADEIKTVHLDDPFSMAYCHECGQVAGIGGDDIAVINGEVYCPACFIKVAVLGKGD